MTVHLLTDPPEADPGAPLLDETTRRLIESFDGLVGPGSATPPVEPAIAAPAPPPRVVIKRALPDKEILAAMSGLGAVLVVRVLLAAVQGGAFWLAWRAMDKPSIMSIVVLVTYALTAVAPLTYLSTKRT